MGNTPRWARDGRGGLETPCRKAVPAGLPISKRLRRRQSSALDKRPPLMGQGSPSWEGGEGEKRVQQPAPLLGGKGRGDPEAEEGPGELQAAGTKDEKRRRRRVRVPKNSSRGFRREPDGWRILGWVAERNIGEPVENMRMAQKEIKGEGEQQQERGPKAGCRLQRQEGGKGERI